MAIYGACGGEAPVFWRFGSLVGLGFFFDAAGPEAMRVTHIGAGENEMGTAEFAEDAEDSPAFYSLFSSSPLHPLRPPR